MDELLLFTLTSPSLQLRWTGSHLQLILTSSSLNPDGRAPTIYTDEPLAAPQMDGLPPTTLIDEALPSAQMDELLLYTLTCPSLHCKWKGFHLQLILTSSSLNPDGRAPAIHSDEPFVSTQMDELLLFTLTSPSLQLRWTGSHLQLILTSSSHKPDGRAPTIHTDMPFNATQMDGLPPTTLIDEALPSTQMDELPLFTPTSP